MNDIEDTPRRRSAAANWAPLARFIAADAQIAEWAGKRPATAFLYEFVRFGLKQGWACLFGGAMVSLLIATSLWYPREALLSRYDFLFVAALAIQIAMLTFRLETFEEAKVILIFHIVGTLMELFKTAVGSWIYPEAALFRLGGVPLFSGSCMRRSAATSPGHGGCSTSVSFGIRRCGRCSQCLWRSTSISIRTTISSISASRCSPLWRFCAAGRGFITRSTIATGECRSFSACSWLRCSSGSPKILVR
jgi:hypothetical protein